jgi:hypothetical protein
MVRGCREPGGSGRTGPAHRRAVLARQDHPFRVSRAGDANPDSDIDLFLLFSEVAAPNKRAAEVYTSLAGFTRPIDIVVSTTSRFERYRNVVNTVYWPASREGNVLYSGAL